MNLFKAIRLQCSSPCVTFAGSFGSVYLAEWNQTLVACKVLITKGKLDTCKQSSNLL